MPSIPRCTAQTAGGNFCDAPAAPDMPFPICLRHALKVHRKILDMTSPENRLETLRTYALLDKPTTQTRRARPSVVYYIAFAGDLVKIGYSTALRKRLSAFSVMPSQVLAVEEGGDALEGRRHVQFAEDRVDQARELFRRSPALDAHIAQLAERNADLRAQLLRVPA